MPEESSEGVTVLEPITPLSEDNRPDLSANLDTTVEMKPVREIPVQNVEAVPYIIENVGQFLSRFPQEGNTSSTALSLHLLNYVHDHPDLLYDRKALREELDRYRQMVDVEIKSARDLTLPSIGTEVEVPFDFFPYDHIRTSQYVGYNQEMVNKWDKVAKAMGLMGIVIKPEGLVRSTEIEFPPTNAASTQSRMIFELRKAGLIPTDRQFASLHISLGIPKPKVGYVETKPNFERLAVDISDLLTYAFVPASRVENRHHASLAVYRGKDNVNTIKARISILDTDISTRVEFRTPRIVGNKTYRLLEEVQRLGILLVNFRGDYTHTGNMFSKKVNDLRRKYRLQSDLPSLMGQQEAGYAIKSAQDIQRQTRQQREHFIQQTGRSIGQAERAIPSMPNLVDDARYIMTILARSVKEAPVENYKRSFMDKISLLDNWKNLLRSLSQTHA